MKNFNLLADFPLFPGGFVGQGCIGLNGCAPSEAPNIFNRVISATLGVITIVAVVWFTITIVSGGIGVMTAGGDKGALESARRKITNGLIGLVITLVGAFIVDMVGYFLLNIDFLKAGGWIESLAIQQP